VFGGKSLFIYEEGVYDEPKIP